jgi:hypothetical protein
MKLSENTSSERKPPKIEASTSEPSAACTAYLKQDYWPTNSSKNASKNTDTGKNKLIPGLWKHNTRPIQFTLVVDNFGVKYVGKEHAQHLKNALKEHYKLTCDWLGKQYIGITLDWDYNKHHIHLSMPNYVQNALKQFEHKAGKLKHAPYQSTLIQYGAKKLYAKQELEAPLLNDKAKWFIQQVCGKFLFLGRARGSGPENSAKKKHSGGRLKFLKHSKGQKNRQTVNKERLFF